MKNVEQSGSRLERVEKPWGYEIWFAVTDKYIGKILFIRKGHRLSLQYHERKDETLYCLRGKASLIVERAGTRDTLPLEPDRSYRIEPMTVHRMEAAEDTTLVEVSTPETEDVVRVEDDYGRVPKSP
jgi:mannose-6-phosphate isomerase-like protein (cupin superfamily)